MHTVLEGSRLIIPGVSNRAGRRFFSGDSISRQRRIPSSMAVTARFQRIESADVHIELAESVVVLCRDENVFLPRIRVRPDSIPGSKAGRVEARGGVRFIFFFIPRNPRTPFYGIIINTYLSGRAELLFNNPPSKFSSGGRRRTRVSSRTGRRNTASRGCEPRSAFHRNAGWGCIPSPNRLPAPVRPRGCRS